MTSDKPTNDEPQMRFRRNVNLTHIYFETSITLIKYNAFIRVSISTRTFQIVNFMPRFMVILLQPPHKLFNNIVTVRVFVIDYIKYLCRCHSNERSLMSISSIDKEKS